MSRYTEQLISDITAYYRERGVALLPHEAEQYLDSLADLGDLLTATIHDGFVSSGLAGGSSAPVAREPPAS